MDGHIHTNAVIKKIESLMLPVRGRGGLLAVWHTTAGQILNLPPPSPPRPRGLTNIQAPLSTAVQLLRNAKGLPFIFLITDGCVADERDICRFVEQVGAKDPPPM